MMAKVVVFVKFYFVNINSYRTGPKGCRLQEQSSLIYVMVSYSQIMTSLVAGKVTITRPDDLT